MCALWQLPSISLYLICFTPRFGRPLCSSLFFGLCYPIVTKYSLIRASLQTRPRQPITNAAPMPQSDEESANPLLLSWVKEWYDTAKEKNSKGVTTYKHAYNALKACPVAFEHPSQLQQLKGFGPKLCERLTVQLQKYCDEEGLPMPEHPMNSRKRKGATVISRAGAVGNGDDGDDDDEAGSSRPPPKKPRKPKQYVPAYRSGAYGLIVALSSMDKDGPAGMAKQELVEAAQPYCDSSFTVPSDPTKFYTAWNSMKTLLTKELVYERGRPTKRYALTDEGWDVARQIQEAMANNGAKQASRNNINSNAATSRDIEPHPESFRVRPGEAPDNELPDQNSKYADVIPNGPIVSDSAALPTFTPIILNPGSFTVHLVLDVREVRAKTDRDYMQEELTKRGVRPIIRAMELGDAQWVAKCLDPDILRRLGSEGDEIVLDHIVERKRLDDLIGSIKDGRFREQKFRLKRSGVKHVTYVIEEMTLSPALSAFHESVESAIASTQVVDGFFVKKTQGIDDSVRYLVRMTERLKKKYESGPLKIIPTRVITAQNYLPLLNHLRATQPLSEYYISYSAFASLASKSELLTLRDLYLKMLMCTRGVTGEKAMQIQQIWKTPNDLVKAFERCGSGEDGRKRKRELVHSQLGNKVKSKQIGKTLSIKIAELWGDA